jgi:hypothetical protein
MEEDHGQDKDPQRVIATVNKKIRVGCTIENAKYSDCDLFNVLSQHPTARNKNTSESLRLNRWFYFVQMANKEVLLQSYLNYS